MREVNIGVIGAGWMARAHTMALRNAVSVFGDKAGAPVFQVIADADESRAKAAAASLAYQRYTTDWREVLKDPSVELVLILTPNNLHYEMVKAALESGKHIFCEKPLSISAAQSRELAALAAGKNLVNYVGFSNLMNPANAYVEDLVKSGALGKVMRITATYDQDMLLDPTLPIAWRHKKALAGSGALGDLCSHLLSVSQMILGDIQEVVADSSLVVPQRPVAPGSSDMEDVENEDIVTFLARYKSGVLGSFGSSRVATGRKNYFYYEIQGTEGSVVYSLERMCEVGVYFKKDEGRDCGYRQVLLNPYHKGFEPFQPAGGIAIGFDDMKILQAHELLEAVTEGGGYAGNFAMGAQVDSVIEAVLASMDSHGWEKVQI